MFTLSAALSVLNSFVNIHILNKNSLYVVDSTVADYVCILKILLYILYIPLHCETRIKKWKLLHLILASREPGTVLATRECVPVLDKCFNWPESSISYLSKSKHRMGSMPYPRWKAWNSKASLWIWRMEYSLENRTRNSAKARHSAEGTISKRSQTSAKKRLTRD